MHSLSQTTPSQLSTAHTNYVSIQQMYHAFIRQQSAQTNLKTGKNEKYVRNLVINPKDLYVGTERETFVQHFQSGPALRLECRQFGTNCKNHGRAVVKNDGGWHSITTTLYGIARAESIPIYVKDCVPAAIQAASEKIPQLRPFLHVASLLSQVRHPHLMIASNVCFQSDHCRIPLFKHVWSCTQRYA